MSETIPADVLKVADEAWLAALKDGTPDAAIIIARAIMAERERWQERIAELEADLEGYQYEVYYGD